MAGGWHQAFLSVTEQSSELYLAGN